MKRVLICALDWGLGHATRCIPVIREFQKQSADVLVASSGPAGVLLRKEFPDLPYFELPGYVPIYPTNNSMMAQMFLQVPKFIRVVRREHETVEWLVKKYEIDIVVSDHRYGCYSSVAKCVFLTHQINVVLPIGWTILAFFVNAICHRYIRKFNEIWVPDQEGSGLTSPFFSSKIAPVRFIGWLSRFGLIKPAKRKYAIMAIVSGPEPQRKWFADVCFEQLKKSGLKALLVTGEPARNSQKVEGLVDVVSHLAAAEMEEAIASSDLVLARSGYSTIMDLIALGKSAIFIPTPQQPEQIFLAHHLMNAGIAFCVEQQHFVLEDAVKEVSRYQGLSSYIKREGLLEKEIKAILI